MDRDTLITFAKEAAKRLDLHMLTGKPMTTTSTVSDAKEEPLTLDTLRGSMELLRNIPPIPTTIWLVDHPEYKDYLTRHLSLRDDGIYGALGYYSTTGIDRLMFIDFDSKDYDPKVHKWWCAVSGIYLEMSDGTVSPIDVGTDGLFEYRRRLD